ncbi:MAG: SET domain-containing protein [Symploca sp. SIO3C6]|uniref:SET domain-containing protein n=1 Tax=Symploca sp. SIO1C4 TaxID=2607765 RepID=A0A6B3N569_9CYAN|nr:SET domain-containing protein [Symploca sp. SIO3C6]NER28239.1 SET domain-containing protein [Symploca sp. SIO1C4]NET04853.1 SET domain-containing protein [Symploca sp. SIO2B6]
MIEVKFFPEKGRGIVATKLIPKGTLIEAAPVVSLPAEQIPLIDQTEVFKYYFVIPSEYEKNQEVQGLLVFGISSFCNHSKTPNAYVKWVKEKEGLWAYLIASKDIQPREEVFLFYTNINKYPLANEFI